MEPDKPVAHFEQDVQLNATELNASSKYIELNTILVQNPDISVRTLAEKLGCSVGTAHTLKKEWEAAHKKEPTAKEPIQIPFITGEKFSDEEASDKKESLLRALEDNFDYMDQYLTTRRKRYAAYRGHPENYSDQPIWSDMDDKDLQKLASVMLRGAKKSAAMAMVVNATIDSADYIAAVTLMGPRLQESGQIIRETQIPRQKRGQKNDPGN